MSDIVELLRIIERLEEIHIEVQGMISYPYLAMKILFDMLRQWSHYLNRCVAASALKVEEAPGASAPSSLEPILVDLEGGRYIGPILPASLSDLIAVRRPAGRSAPKGDSGGGGVSGHKKPLPTVAATGGSTQVRVRYDAHLPSLSL